jgi:hemolysin activation/secretion protein
MSPSVPCFRCAAPGASKSALVCAVLALMAAALAMPGYAQVAPTAGSILQQNVPPPPPVQPSQPNFNLAPPSAPADSSTQTTTVEINSVTLVGNTLFKEATLKTQMGDFVGHRYNLTGLRTLSEKIAAYYRLHNYPFTRVVLPPQDLTSGDLRIQIVEGRYGQVGASGTPDLLTGVKPFLAGIKPGQFIAASRLERTMLIINDQSGMTVYPTIASGTNLAEGDLTANVRRKARFGGDVGLDNGGSRYVGNYRIKFDAFAYSPFMFGDKISLSGLYSDLGLWLLSLQYEAPLGGSGLRGSVQASQTTYYLGDQFKSLRATGYARVGDIKLSYPLLRSQITNVSVSGGPEFKALQDNYRALGVVNDKTAVSLPVTFQFDTRDHFLGGALTYGVVAVTHGRLFLGQGLAATDSATAHTAGDYNKLYVDISRIQGLGGPVSAFLHFAGQWSDKNLDASEKIVMGGYLGVRSYPVGEGQSDRGWLIQSEARYHIGLLQPYVLFDAAGGQINAKPWDAPSRQARNISGVGLGTRFSKGGLAADVSVAWQVYGGAPTSDSRDTNPMVWASINYRF